MLSLVVMPHAEAHYRSAATFQVAGTVTLSSGLPLPPGAAFGTLTFESLAFAAQGKLGDSVTAGTYACATVESPPSTFAGDAVQINFVAAVTCSLTEGFGPASLAIDVTGTTAGTAVFMWMAVTAPHPGQVHIGPCGGAAPPLPSGGFTLVATCTVV